MIDHDAPLPGPANAADGSGGGSSETTIDRSTVDGLTQHFLAKAKATSQPSAKPAIPPESSTDDEFVAADTTPPKAEDRPSDGPDDVEDDGDEGTPEPEEFTGNPDDESQLALRSLPKEELDRTFKVKASGKVIEVPLRDALLSYSSHNERTRMAADLRERQRIVDLAADRYLSELTAVSEQLDALTPAEPDWNLIKQTEGYEAFIQKRDAWDQVQRVKADVANKRQQAEQQRQQQQLNQARDFVAQQGEMLLKRMPVLKDAQKAQQFSKEVKDYLATEGLSLDGVGPLDHRYLVIVAKAMRYDQQRKAVATAKGTNMVRPNSAPTPSAAAPRRTAPVQAEVNKARGDFRKAGSVDSLAALLVAKEKASQSAARRRR